MIEWERDAWDCERHWWKHNAPEEPDGLSEAEWLYACEQGYFETA